MLLALDYGSRYIGIAITDPDERLALRHSVVDQKKADAFVVLAALVEKEKVEKVIVGMPISLSGKESEQTHLTRAFIEKLRAALPATITIEEADETLTSWSADEHIKLEGGKKEDAHSEAARLILETYLTNVQ